MNLEIGSVLEREVDEAKHSRDDTLISVAQGVEQEVLRGDQDLEAPEESTRAFIEGTKLTGATALTLSGLSLGLALDGQTASNPAMKNIMLHESDESALSPTAVKVLGAQAGPVEDIDPEILGYRL